MAQKYGDATSNPRNYTNPGRRVPYWWTNSGNNIKEDTGTGGFEYYVGNQKLNLGERTIHPLGCLCIRCKRIGSPGGYEYGIPMYPPAKLPMDLGSGEFDNVQQAALALNDMIVEQIERTPRQMSVAEIQIKDWKLAFGLVIGGAADNTADPIDAESFIIKAMQNPQAMTLGFVAFSKSGTTYTGTVQLVYLGSY